jgi:hypothetical protein
MESDEQSWVFQMTEDELAPLRQHRFAPSRIPKLDALATFVAAGHESDPVVVAATKRVGFSRWFTIDGGHRVLIPFEGGEYDCTRFSIESEVWDHETCKLCRMHIPSMALCWVTERGPYIILCEECHGEVIGSRTSA